MKKFIVCFLLSVSAFTFAQDNSKLNYFVINDSYPIPIGDNFISKSDYWGINALEIGYHYNLSYNIFVGLNCRYAFLYRSVYPVNVEIINPSISINYHYNIGKFWIIPQINIGYSKYRFYSEGRDNEFSFYSANNAFTLTSQIKATYPITDKLFLGALVAYDFSMLDKSKGITEYNNYNQRLQFIYPGISLEVKL